MSGTLVRRTIVAASALAQALIGIAVITHGASVALFWMPSNTNSGPLTFSALVVCALFAGAALGTAVGYRRFGSALGVVAGAALALVFLVVLLIHLVVLPCVMAFDSSLSSGNKTSYYATARNAGLLTLAAIVTTVMSTLAWRMRDRGNSAVSDHAVVVGAFVLVALAYFFGIVGVLWTSQSVPVR